MERREYYFLDSSFLPYYAGGVMVFKGLNPGPSCLLYSLSPSLLLDYSWLVKMEKTRVSSTKEGTKNKGHLGLIVDILIYSTGRSNHVC
jgi:hypothetical protein